MKILSKLMLVGLLFVSVVTLGGCDDAKIKEAANERLKLAQTQLQEARDFGAAKYAPELYSLAEIKYSEGKARVDAGQYDLAIKDWEDFQVLITKAKAQAIMLRDKDTVGLNAQKNAEKAKKEAEERAAAEKAKAEASLAQQQALIAQQQRLEEEALRAQALKAEALRLEALRAEQLRLAALQPSKAVVVSTPVTPVAKAPIVKTDKGTRVVVLKKGDHLCKIARSQYGDHMEWRRIFKLNNKSIKNPDLVYPGQAIVLPK